MRTEYFGLRRQSGAATALSNGAEPTRIRFEFERRCRAAHATAVQINCRRLVTISDLNELSDRHLIIALPGNLGLLQA